MKTYISLTEWWSRIKVLTFTWLCRLEKNTMCCLLHDFQHSVYLKPRDRQRKWNVISLHSILEKKCCELMSTSGTAAARQSSPCQTVRGTTVICSNHFTDDILFGSSQFYFLTYTQELHRSSVFSLLFTRLHKCICVFPLMSSSITDKYLLIYQLCCAWQSAKWAEWLRAALTTTQPARTFSNSVKKWLVMLILTYWCSIHLKAPLCFGRTSSRTLRIPKLYTYTNIYQITSLVLDQNQLFRQVRCTYKEFDLLRQYRHWQ